MTNVGGNFTYEDYIGWTDVRCELIDGVRRLMAGVSEWHMGISFNLTQFIGQLRSVFSKGKYFAFHSPFDVILFPEEEFLKTKTVVQPDFGICLKEKRKGRVIVGAPEFLIEITSSNPAYDYQTKFELYQRAGVLEYWIISPREGIITIFLYDAAEKKYGEPSVYELGITPEKTVKSTVIEGLEIVMSELFDFSDL